MRLKAFALSLTAAFVLGGLGCKPEQPGAPPPPKPKTSAVPSPAASPSTSTAFANPAEHSTVSKESEDIEDAVITGKVRTALLKGEGIKSTEIDVETQKGVVQLSGFVPTNSDIERAVHLATQVDGVKAVQNRLAVKPS